MDPLYIVLICLAAAVVIALIVIIALAVRNKRLRDGQGDRAEEIKIVDGIRYSRTDAIASSGDVKITHREGDFVLAQGKTVKAVKDGSFMPGTYTVLSANESLPVFKLRLGGYVRECKHGDVVVVAEGETVSAVSCTVVFR